MGGGAADEALVDLVDALLNISDPNPAAYRAYLGAGVLEDALGHASAAWAVIVAEKCRLFPAWREAVAGAVLDDQQRTVFPMLRPYLPQAR